MENKISEVEMIVRTIFFSPATNGQAETSIAKGIELINGLLTTRNDEVVKMVEKEIIHQSQDGSLYTAQVLRTISTKLKEDKK